VFQDELASVSTKSIMEEVDEEMEKETRREEERTKRREKIGMVEEAVPVLDNEKSFEHYSRGEEYFQEGNYEDAILEFEASVQYNPEIWQTYQFMGSALFALGREEAAVGAYEKCLELNPDNADLNKWLEEHHHKKKKAAEAEAAASEENKTEEEPARQESE